MISAVVEKDEEGKVHIKNEMDRGVKVGAVGGGALGLLIGGLIFPVAGIAIGVLGGALVGSSFDLGIEKKFVNEVAESLKDNNSALFIVVRDSNPNAALADSQTVQRKCLPDYTLLGRRGQLAPGLEPENLGS